ncbi:AAA domain-containing protein [Campylobacter coli]|nr:hypothetical protein [Campylobacter coli]EAJ7514420.1 hypothetical protein [Campylobacter coli]EDO9269751.1 hypothetical protein [Campylobacter coli]HEB8039442.1 hypothetical protein [Campylobacter coli]HEB8082439.1 hypothetical protein [Campylobacter coli]
MSSNIDILKYLLFVEYLTPQNIKKINNCCDTCETSYINQYIREKIEKICNALTLNNKNLDDYSVEIIIQGAIYENKALFENIINKFNINKDLENFYDNLNTEYASFVLKFNGRLNFTNENEIIKFNEFNSNIHQNFNPIIDNDFVFNAKNFYLSTAPWAINNIENIKSSYIDFINLSQNIAKELSSLKNICIDKFYDKAIKIIERDVPLLGNKFRISVNLTKTINENVFLNSFYIQELANILNNYEENKFPMIDKYLSNKIKQRIDIKTNQLEILENYIDELAPSSFVSQFALMYSQQFAVNKILKMNKDHNDIYSINGPPGTGKTTLVKDIIAGIITQRAIEISKLNYDEIIKKEDGIYKLNEKLKGYEIILSSSNNNAVENISKEIPTNNGIDSSYIQDLDYFSEIATRFLNRNKKTEIKAWGLICGILGNNSNKSSFIYNVLKDFKSKEYEFIGLINYIKSNKLTDKDFEQAKNDFNQALRRVNNLLDKNKKEKHIIQKVKIYNKLKNSGSLINTITYLYKLLSYRLMGKNYVKNIEKHISFLNQKFYLHDEASMEKSSFFMVENGETTELSKARKDLFIKALNLHKVAILSNNLYFAQNLEVLSDILENNNYRNLSENKIVEIWKSLFFMIPSISSTYASFCSCFKDIGHNQFGYLISDESGQSTITSAIGAIYRTKKAIIIGDPLQLEPIVNIPNNINNFFIQYFNIDKAFDVKNTSLQSRCDFLQSYGRYIYQDSQKIWLGSPLRVHNRCDRPIFELSNKIAYGGMMIYGKKNENTLQLQNTWYNIKEEQWNGNCNEREIEYLHILLDEITQYDLEIGIITPFVDVKQKLKDIANKYNNLKNDKIGTIHTMQGKEADIIILILGGNNENARNWVASRPNLINVALTRAKNTIFIIGNKEKYIKLNYFNHLESIHTITPSFSNP